MSVIKRLGLFLGLVDAEVKAEAPKHRAPAAAKKTTAKKAPAKKSTAPKHKK